MNRRILMSVLAIAMTLALVGGGTFALYQDTEISSGNTFTSGTLDLKVSDNDEFVVDGVSATWVMNNMAPGVSTVINGMSLINSGSLAGDHVEIAFSHSIDEVTNPVESDTNPASLPGDMAEWIQVTSCVYDGVVLVGAGGTLIDANGNGWIDLEDVTLPANTVVGGPLDNLPAPPPNSGGIQSFTMALAFHVGATNDIQGDILTTTITFTLNQHSSQ